MELRPEFDTRETGRALKGSALESPPPLHDYAPRLWDYWEREMDSGLDARTLAAGGADGQARADHGRLVGDRLGGGAESRGRGRGSAAGRAKRGEARGAARRDRRGRRHGVRVRGGPVGHGVGRPAGRAGARRPQERGHARQQCGALDQALDRAELRPLSRLRTDDAAELLRRGQADHRADGAHARAGVGAHREHLLDRRADQPAALLRVCGLEGGARRFHAESSRAR